MSPIGRKYVEIFNKVMNKDNILHKILMIDKTLIQ